LSWLVGYKLLQKLSLELLLLLLHGDRTGCRERH
jgi:hypothetical protein